MSLADRFRKVMGVPPPIDPLEARRTAFREASGRRDEIASLENALAFTQAQMFDDALGAFRHLEEVFPLRKAEWLRWQGQLLYIQLAHRAKNEAERAAIYERAIACYFQAAELGDRSQEFNVVELCEQLAAESSIPAERKHAAFARYLALFPHGPGRRRVESLRA
jgi:hypothetical protein